MSTGVWTRSSSEPWLDSEGDVALVTVHAADRDFIALARVVSLALVVAPSAWLAVSLLMTSFSDALSPIQRSSCRWSIQAAASRRLPRST